MYNMAGFDIIAACAIAWFSWFIDDMLLELLCELELEPLPPEPEPPEPEPPYRSCCCAMAA